MKHKMRADYYSLYKISWYIRILLCKRYLSTLLSCDYEVLFLLLLVANGFQWIIIKLTLTPTPFKILYFHYKTLFKLTFLIFFHYPNFSIITNHCINNDQHNNLCHEAWSLYLVFTKSFGTCEKVFVRGVNHALRAHGDIIIIYWFICKANTGSTGEI